MAVHAELAPQRQSCDGKPLLEHVCGTPICCSPSQTTTKFPAASLATARGLRTDCARKVVVLTRVSTPARTTDVLPPSPSARLTRMEYRFAAVPVGLSSRY
jgi:hypothetical protein